MSCACSSAPSSAAGFASRNRRRRNCCAFFAPVGLGEFEAAVARLESLPASDPEWLALIESLTVHETYIMRDAPQLAFFAKLLPDMIARAAKGSRLLRFWSVGCASGEEAYSIAALALDALAKAGKAAVTEDGIKLLPPWRLEIIGADISSRALARAEAGIYETGPLSSFRTEAAALLHHFPPLAANGRSASPMRAATPALKRVVRFSQFNVVADAAPPEPFDAVFCRNVFIYFSERARREAQQKLAGTVRPGGLLLLGPTDTLSDVTAFETLWAPGALSTAGEAAMPEPGPQPTKPAVLFARGDKVYAVAAERVAKVVAMPPVVFPPLLPDGIDGVAAIAGKVVPILALSETGAGRELILVTCGGDDYGLRADRVLRLSDAMTDVSTAQPVDVDALVAALRAAAAARAASVPQRDESLPSAFAEDSSDAATAAPLKSAAIVVETASATYLLPLDCVIELCESLSIVPLPDARPFLSGAGFHRDALLPVVSLAALLDGAAADAPAEAFVVATAGGRRCILAVKRISGNDRDTNPERVADLAALLANILPEEAPAEATKPPAAAEVQAAGRYLLIEQATQACAFPLELRRAHSCLLAARRRAGHGRDMARRHCSDRRTDSARS